MGYMVVMIIIGVLINCEENKVEDLLRTSFFTYVIMVVFVGLCMLLFCIGVMKHVNKFDKKIKVILRIAICSIFIGSWSYFAVVNAYPVSLAYYEYMNNITEEKSGTVESIVQDGKDRIHININGTIYTVVYSSKNLYNNIATDIFQGDMVKFQVGKHSKYIFDIKKCDK